MLIFYVLHDMRQRGRDDGVVGGVKWEDERNGDFIWDEVNGVHGDGNDDDNDN